MKCLLFVLLMLVVPTVNSALTMGPNGVIYGNVCQTQRGWQYVNWAPVGTNCWSQGWQMWGYIVNA